ncbi:MAG: DUF1080 domain-containing protein [Planctomycetales bacterium]|nr:DUF1080 domain-containing protein [Planctomycetales bacterium]
MSKFKLTPPPLPHALLLVWLTLPAVGLVGNSFVRAQEGSAKPTVAAAQAAPPESSNLKSLFDGKSLEGWDGDPRLWSVRDGVIHGETTATEAANRNTFLIWRGGSTEDFELRLSFRCNATNNSGIQYRSQHITDKDAPNAWVLRGYQHELRNEVDFPNVSGFIYGEGLSGRGRICLVGEKAHMVDGKKVVTASLINQDAFRELFRLDDWNDVVIIAEGRHLRHYMNGRLILDFTDAEDLALSSGVLGLQLHAGKPMWAEFKNIRIAALPAR